MFPFLQCEKPVKSSKNRMIYKFFTLQNSVLFISVCIMQANRNRPKQLRKCVCGVFTSFAEVRRGENSCFCMVLTENHDRRKNRNISAIK